MKCSLIFIVVFVLAVNVLAAQAIYEMPKQSQSPLSSFENPNGIKGNGGTTNKTAKGNAFEFIESKQTKTLLDVKGQGIIQRI